ncbi:MAG: hypothetical protein KGJ78_16830 [Alphaproteobacteria bacterium]|nr:hypothetical protein [Alphaproteobacteria bacterium]
MYHKLALAAAAALLLSPAAYAESSVSDVMSTLTASPPSYVGTCPAQITFTGTITVRGTIDPSASVEMGYTFLRSDNATGPIAYYTISAPGTRTVSTTWTLGGPGLPAYDGWIQLKAWPTRHLGFGYSFSPKAMFHVRCAAAGGGPGIHPRLNVAASLMAAPAVYNDRCPAVITFRGQISVTGAMPAPVQIAYTFLRSDGATGPIEYFTVNAPGTRPVETTWTLGGASLPSFAGWEQLKAWPTRHEDGFGFAFSPRAEFRMNCR